MPLLDCSTVLAYLIVVWCLAPRLAGSRRQWPAVVLVLSAAPGGFIIATSARSWLWWLGVYLFGVALLLLLRAGIAPEVSPRAASEPGRHRPHLSSGHGTRVARSPRFGQTEIGSGGS